MFCQMDNRLPVDFLRKAICIEFQLNISKFDQSFDLIYSEEGTFRSISASKKSIDENNEITGRQYSEPYRMR